MALTTADVLSEKTSSQDDVVDDDRFIIQVKLLATLLSVSSSTITSSRSIKGLLIVHETKIGRSTALYRSISMLTLNKISLVPRFFLDPK